jgi:hypothetical protein
VMTCRLPRGRATSRTLQRHLSGWAEIRAHRGPVSKEEAHVGGTALVSGSGGVGSRPGVSDRRGIPCGTADRTPAGRSTPASVGSRITGGAAALANASGTEVRDSAASLSSDRIAWYEPRAKSELCHPLAPRTAASGQMLRGPDLPGPPSTPTMSVSSSKMGSVSYTDIQACIGLQGGDSPA